jgi:hypothetical protein
MTKLLEWLFGVSVFLGIWCALISRQIQAQLLEEWMHIIVTLPLILVTVFGVSIIIYGTELVIKAAISISIFILDLYIIIIIATYY